MLRFCQLTSFYPPYNFGGDGIGVQRLSQGLVRNGHHVTVIHDIDAYNSVHDGPEPPPAVIDDGVNVVGLRSGVGSVSPALTQQLGRPLVNGARIRRLLDEGGFDVLHYHNVSLLGGPGLLSIGGGVKLYTAQEHWLVCPSHVLWRHDREACTGRECLRCVLSYRRPPQVWRYTGGLERKLHHVDSFIALSAFSRDKHREFGFSRDMEVMSMFLPDAPGPSGPAERRATEPLAEPAPAGPSPHGRPYFLFVGRLEKIKGLDDVIPLFRDYPSADLLIAGRGRYESELRALAADIPSVRFVGQVPADDLAAYYRNAVALVVPSVGFETFGLIIMEAYAAGTPVICRRIGPFPEIVELAGSGLLFSTPTELLAAMGRLQSDPDLRARHIRQGLEGLRDHYSESAVLPHYFDIVRRAAERKGDQRVAALAR